MRKIIHVDMDAFYAAVEARAHPEHAGGPLAVGGRRRGVIVSANYAARRYGIRAAMPTFEARRRCPDLVVIKPRMDVYRAVSREVQRIIASYSSLVEPLSLDEAFLDVTEPTRGPTSATLLAAMVRAEIAARTGLTASAGVSNCRFVAKVASAMSKPDGLLVVPPAQVEAFIARLPIERFYGVGPATAARMKRLGVHTGHDLRGVPEAVLCATFGRRGRHFYRIARGIDERRVRSHRGPRRSMSSSRTYATDLQSKAALEEPVYALAARLATRMADAGCAARTVTLTCKDRRFHVTSRSSSRHPVAGLDDLRRVALALLRTLPYERPVRLLGLRLTNLLQTPYPRQLDLIEDASHARP